MNRSRCCCNYYTPPGCDFPVEDHCAPTDKTAYVSLVVAGMADNLCTGSSNWNREWIAGVADPCGLGGSTGGSPSLGEHWTYALTADERSLIRVTGPFGTCIPPVGACIGITVFYDIDTNITTRSAQIFMSAGSLEYHIFLAEPVEGKIDCCHFVNVLYTHVSTVVSGGRSYTATGATILLNSAF